MRPNAVLALFAVLACARATPPAPAELALDHVTVSAIAPGVYAAIRRDEPLGLAGNANSLFIVNDADVVVVDAQFTREATLENLAALRRITRKPVSFVVNTHWHDDHLAGNQVYRDSFPNVRFIAHANTRDDLIAKGRPNRVGQVQFAPGAVARFDRLLAMGLGGDSTPVTPVERASLANALRIIRRYVAEAPGFRETLPDSVIAASTTLRRGRRTIELRWFGRGNTRGDVVVYLPAEGVVATGDLIVAPIPYGFGSYPSEWIADLDSIAALRPRVLVPGHGPLMRDLSYVSTERRLLATARDRVRQAKDSGVPTDSIARTVTLSDLRAEIAGDEKWMKTMFDSFFRRPVVNRLIEELTKGRLE